MRILLVGGNKIGRVEAALEQRFKTIEAKAVKSAKEIKALGLAGERFERVLLFEQAITRDGAEIDSKEVRLNAQEIIDNIKEALGTFDLVCIADSIVAVQAMREETFEIKHRAVVVHIRTNSIAANELVSFASKAIAELRDIYKGDDVDSGIYRSIDSVMWSAEIPRSESWEEDWNEYNGCSDVIGRAAENMEFDVATGKFVEKQSVENKQDNEKSTGAANKKAEPVKKKHKALFGNRKV